MKIKEMFWNFCCYKREHCKVINVQKDPFQSQ